MMNFTNNQPIIIGIDHGYETEFFDLLIRTRICNHHQRYILILYHSTP